jgi:hypothetical protein
VSSSAVHNVRTEFETSGRLRTAGNKCQHKERAGKYDISVKTAV